MANHSILLESGTNEVEFVRFTVDGRDYGINVAKVRSIVPYDPALVTPLPQAHEAVAGMFQLQGENHTLINLQEYLHGSPCELGKRTLVLVAEINQEIVGFIIQGVNRIYRTSWENFDPIDSTLIEGGVPVVGMVRVEERAVVLILDFEGILAAISPNAGLHAGTEHAHYVPPQSQKAFDRASVPILVAEDSRIIRMEMVQILQDLGYSTLGVFENGRLAWDYICRCVDETGGGAALRERLGVVITDIEMPMMDGTTLCRHIKERRETQDVPVILYSSMVTEDLVHRFHSVGADAFASKREIPRLLETLDGLARERAG